MSDRKSSTGAGPHDGHRARLRERFRAAGPAGFAPHETLEFLLTYCIPRVNTNEIAHALIDRFGSLSRAIDASAEELCTVPGVGPETAVFFNLLSFIRRQCEMDECDTDQPFNTVQRVTTYLQASYTGVTNERATMLLFDNGMHMLADISLGEGTVNCTPLTTRKVVEEALKYRAACVVLAHNHPHGIPVPSGNDIAVTEEIEHVLRSVSIPLLEHFIVTEHDCTHMLRNRHHAVVPASDDRTSKCFCATFYGEPLEAWMSVDAAPDTQWL